MFLTTAMLSKARLLQPPTPKKRLSAFVLHETNFVQHRKQNKKAEKLPQKIVNKAIKSGLESRHKKFSQQSH
jgi:hypothetical protein